MGIELTRDRPIASPMSSLSMSRESTPDSAIAPAAPTAQPTEIVYPSADGKPVAETYLHFERE
jgi:hypothetical protein